MNLCACFILLAFMASFAYAVEFSLEDVRLYLPLLEKFKLPPECPPNELYRNCMGNCSDCTNRSNCVIEQCIEGCDCAPRFFRLQPGGPCMPVAKCPIPDCDENEVFRECGPLCERCTTIRCRITSCDHKCYCKEGYLRNNEGKCVPEEECPKRKRCSHTEEWSESGPMDEFCSQRNSTACNETQDVPQCYCKEGHKRNTLGFCIKEELCSSIKCFGCEVYHDCIPKCNTTCRNYGDPDCVEDDNCYPGCFCPPGYVMNDFRACIPAEECKPDVEHVLVMADAEYEESTDEESTTIANYDESVVNENATEIPSHCETTEDYTSGPDVDLNMSTKPADNKETFPAAKASTVSVNTTLKPSESSTTTSEQSYKARRKMKTSKSHTSSSVASSSAYAKQQSTRNEDYIDNEEF